jgi:hypothetical protein
LGMQPSSGTVGTLDYFWQLGVGSARLEGTPTVYNAGNTGEEVTRTGPASPLWVDIAESTALQVRATCGGTAEAQNVAIYGVY